MKRQIPVLALLLILAPLLLGADRITGKKFATRSEVIAQNGMVASSHPLATQVGVDILKKGGSAVDAAIAVNATLGLMEPTGSGIGGDLFAIVYDAKTQKLSGLNASGPAPATLTRKAFKGMDRVPYDGVLPWTVPGCVDGWFELHSRFGKLPMKKILAPSIAYANNGFPMTELIAYYWKRSVDKFVSYPNFQKLYAPSGMAPAKGDVFKNPDLAATYTLLAKKGRNAFYEGKIAKKIDAYSRANGGYLTYEDLATYKSEWVDPLSANKKAKTANNRPPTARASPSCRCCACSSTSTSPPCTTTGRATCTPSSR
jgi:gamma-glutamyltranspeptidase/glutathione hydrolase